MATLKNPNVQIPGGFVYYEPATRWSPPPFSSLDSIVNQLLAHRAGRPDLIQRLGWSMDRATVYQQVLQYQVLLCLQNGWSDYLTGGSEGAVPFQAPPPPSLIRRARNVVAGSQILVDWIQEGQPVVAQEVANRRGEICAACPKNGKGGLEAYFTVPVSNAIRHELERKQGMNLKTPSDDSVNVCTACSCPIPLKLWVPLENILPKLKPDQKAALDPSCWITK